MTRAQLYAAVRALGLVIKRTEGGDEYRLAFRVDDYPGEYPQRQVQQENQAYYSPDELDVLATAVAMVKQRDEQRQREARAYDMQTLDVARD